MAKAKSTKEKISEAIDTVVKLFPEDADIFTSNRDYIIKHLVSDTKLPGDNSALAASVKAYKTPSVLPRLVSVTPCQEALALVAVDAMFFTLELAGMPYIPVDHEKYTHSVIRHMGLDRLLLLRRFVWVIKNANGDPSGMAAGLLGLMLVMYDAGGPDIAWEIMKNEMIWIDWITQAPKILAQLVIWFSSEGGAFVAEAILTITSATELISDVAKAVDVCNCRDMSRL